MSCALGGSVSYVLGDGSVSLQCWASAVATDPQAAVARAMDSPPPNSHDRTQPRVKAIVEREVYSVTRSRNPVPRLVRQPLTRSKRRSRGL